MNVTEHLFPGSKTKTDLWPVAASSGCQACHQARFFLLFLDFLHRVTRQTALFWMKVLIAALGANYVELRALNTGVLRRVDGGRRSVLQKFPNIIPSKRKAQATSKSQTRICSDPHSFGTAQLRVSQTGQWPETGAKHCNVTNAQKVKLLFGEGCITGLQLRWR